MVGDDKNIQVVVTFHVVVSARHFYQLRMKLSDWDLLTMPKVATKYLIDRSESNIFLPGLNFREYLETTQGPALMVISTPWEGDPLYEAFAMLPGTDIAFVSFANKREQMLFKLAHV